MIGFLYYLYERHLLKGVRRKAIPRHIGIILDGNRRYAREQGLADPLVAYQRGAQKLDDVLVWCGELGIPMVTLWVFSTENLTRPPEEVNGLLAVVEKKLGQIAQDPRVHKRKVRVRAVGKLDLLPDRTLAAIRRAEAATAAYDQAVLTIAVAYGGRQ